MGTSDHSFEGLTLGGSQARKFVPPITTSIFVTTGIILVFLLLELRMFDWFIIPIWACGALITPDAIRWLNNQYDTFHPRGLIGILGFHFFFLAPLLFVYWDLDMLYVLNPDCWKSWIGWASALNLIGIIAYKFALKVYIKPRHISDQPLWSIIPRKFWVYTTFFLIVGIITFTIFSYQVGGLSNIIAERTVRSGIMSGMGWLLIFAETVPILIFFILIQLKGNLTSRRPLLFTIVILLAFFFIMQFFIGGLRGSRENTIIALFWGCGLIHYYWRPITKKMLIIALIPFLAFMVFYGYYKNLGDRVFGFFKGQITFQELNESAPNRGLQYTVVSDLARVCTQAFIVYRLVEYPDEYSISYGRTYIAAISGLVPEKIWPNRPDRKVKEGTELLYGKGAYIPGIHQSSRVYGLMGESVLNFHFPGVVFAFTIWGLFVGHVTRWLQGLKRGDARLLIAPLFIWLTIKMLLFDLDNNIFFLIKNGLVPIVIVLISTSSKKNRI